MADDELVEQLERFRQEQRAIRAQRHGRHRQMVGGSATGTRLGGTIPAEVGPADGQAEVKPAAAEPRPGLPRYRDHVGTGPVPYPLVDHDDGRLLGGFTDQPESPPDAPEEELAYAPAGPPWGERLRTGIRGLGETLITFGMVVLLFIAYELWFTDLTNHQKQGQLQNQLAQEWNTGEDPVVGEPGVKVRNIPLGQSIALIRIPALGLDYVRAIVEGTGPDSLAEGPGHYVNSVLPGQVGNFAVAGHRVGKGSPFLDLDRLRAGDPIVIETGKYYYVYRVLGNLATKDPTVPGQDGIPGQEIVTPSDVDVVAPVPDHPGMTPHRRMLTLTTCNPRFSASQRLVIHAELAGQPWPKSKGLPPALKG